MDSSGDTVGVQSLNEIENYLVNFNKEISEDVDQRFMMATHGSGHMENGSHMYSDPSIIYHQTTTCDNSMGIKTERTMLRSAVDMCASTVVPSIQTSCFDLDTGTDGMSPHLLALQGAPVGVATRVMTTDDNPADDMTMMQTSTDISNQTAGNGPYQTVTIVPSEVDQGGEVSYVLIVSQPDGKGNDGDTDLSVYDFKEEKIAIDVESFKQEVEEEQPQPKRLRRSAGVLDASTVSVVNSGGMGMHLRCNYCSYTSPRRYLLSRHMKAHSEERPHKCAICGRMFKTVIALQNHVNTHTGVRPQHCKECDASFTTSGELVRHVRYRHTYEKPHRCTECDYASVELSKLRRHIRSHTGERPYACPHCPYASPDTYKLKRHLRTHTGEKPYECDICGLRFTQSNSLKAHKMIHTGEKPIFQCELCPTTCGRKTDLKYHVMKLHTSERALLCRKCGKAFPDRYTYKIHLKTHEGEKCFRCELCPYSALDQRHLESHILTHTGEKPYACTYCDQSFRQKQLLRRHINLYHIPGYVPPAPRDKVHPCSHCHKHFAHRGNLLRHLALHDPNNIDYLEAIKQHDASTGEEDEGDENELEDEDGTTFLELQNATGVGEGMQLTEIDGEQVQVQLVRVSGEEGEQVYLQIGTEQMEMLTHQQAQQVQEEAGLMITVDEEGSHDSQSKGDNRKRIAPKLEVTPSKRPRGRPRKNPATVKQDSDDDYTPASKTTRGRGRPRGSSSRSVTHKMSVVDDDTDDEQSSRRQNIKLVHNTSITDDPNECDLTAEFVSFVQVVGDSME